MWNLNSEPQSPLLSNGDLALKTGMAQERLRCRIATAEVLEDLCRVSPTPKSRYRVSEASSNALNLFLVLKANLLEGPEGIRAQKAVLGKRRHDREFRRDLLLHFPM